jgi:8-oxo-dGTP pyrophosphatase MutT (NUDIX family)
LFAVFRVRQTGAKCVLEQDGCVLLVRHTYGDRRRWELPGGGVHRGEDVAEGARREVREELGIDVDDLRHVGSRVLTAFGSTFCVHYFHAELASRTLQRDRGELAAVEWFSPRALPRPLGLSVAEAVALACGLAAPAEA